MAIAGEPAATGDGPNPNPNPNPNPSANLNPDAAGKTPKPAAEVRPVAVLPEDWAAVQRELADLRGYRTAKEAKEEAAESERLKALAAKGQAEEALKQLQSAYESKNADLKARHDAIEQRWLAERKAGVIAEALAGVEFAGVDPTVTAKHVRQLLEGEVEAVLDRDGRPQVRERATLAPADRYLRERLASTEFALYLRPRGKGGAGGDGTRTPQPPADGGAVKPGSLEAIAAEYRDRMSRYQSLGLHRIS